MAVQNVFGGDVIWHSEIDKAASKVLAYRFPGVPNLGSITEIDWATVEPVDVLCGGFPCTDVSAAGKRAGMHGTRSGLWSHMAEAIDVLRPRYVVIENVRGLLNANANRPLESAEDDLGDGSGRPVLRAIGAVLGDISDIGGYEARWVTVAAADVGAPHRRERVFIVAYANAEHARSCGEADDARGWEPDAAGRGWRCESEGSRAASESRSQQIGASTDTRRDGCRRGAECHLEPPTGIAAPHRDHIDRCAVADGRDLGRADVDLLPTPTSCDYKPTSSPSDLERHSPGLGVVTAHFPALLPTPRVGGGGDCESERRRNSPGLESIAVSELLPTPNASDCTGGGMHPDSRYNADGVRHSQQLIDAVKLEPERFWGKYAPAIARWEHVLGRPAPPPTEPNKNGNPRLAAEFSSWLMGWPEGWVTDPAIGISRNDQLKICGNGVVPQQAAAALRYLLSVEVNG
jgi:DNA (cytosine-5)-methyltransferase 1